MTHEINVDLDELIAWLNEQTEIHYDGRMFRRGRKVTYSPDGTMPFLTFAAIQMKEEKATAPTE